MPAPERSELFQTAVLWRYLGLIDGEVQLAPPVELTYPYGVRWTTARREGKDAKGQKVSLDATAVVNTRIAVDSVIWLGTLDEWYGSGSGSGGNPDSEVMQVVNYQEVPDLKNRESFKTISMMRYRGAPPP